MSQETSNDSMMRTRKEMEKSNIQFKSAAELAAQNAIALYIMHIENIKFSEAKFKAYNVLTDYLATRGLEK